MPLDVQGRKPGYSSTTKPQTAPMRGGRVQSLAESAVQRQLPQGAPKIPETPRVEGPTELPFAPDPVAELAAEQTMAQPLAQRRQQTEQRKLPGGFTVQPVAPGVQAAPGLQALSIPGALATPTAPSADITRMPDDNLMRALGYLQDFKAVGTGAQKPGGEEDDQGPYPYEGEEKLYAKPYVMEESGEMLPSPAPVNPQDEHVMINEYAHDMSRPAYNSDGVQVGWYSPDGTEFFDMNGRLADNAEHGALPFEASQPLSWGQEAYDLYQNLGESEEAKAARHERMLADVAAAAAKQAEQMAARGGGGSAQLGYGDLWSEGVRQLGEQDFQISQAATKNKLAMLDTAMRAAQAENNLELQEQIHKDQIEQRERFFFEQMEFKKGEAVKGEELEYLANMMGLTGVEQLPISVFGQLMQEGLWNSDDPSAFNERFEELMTEWLQSQPSPGGGGGSMWDDIKSGASWVVDKTIVQPLEFVKSAGEVVWNIMPWNW